VGPASPISTAKFAKDAKGRGPSGDDA